MRNYFLAVISILFTIQGVAQLTEKPLRISKYSNQNETVAFADTSVLLPFWDDFAATGPQLDSGNWQIGENITVNNTFTINTPSAYVATFDGIDGNGRPYSSDPNFNGPGDSLVSQRILLNAVPSSLRSTVYMSFFYQLKGLGEIPDEKDSLQLQFYGRDSTWTIVDLTPDDPTGFAITGGIDNVALNEDSVLSFEQIIIPIEGSQYFHENFRFKFISYSSLAGVYDSWNLDYIYINQNRTPDRQEHRDRTISGTPSALFYPFSAIPANQFIANPNVYNRPQTITLSNLENEITSIEYVHSLFNTNTGQSITSGSIFLDDEVGFRQIEFDREVQGLAPEALSVSGDSVVILSEWLYLTGDSALFEIVDIEGRPLYTDIDLKVNDTLRTYHNLTNFYAFDDGSAEFTAGINLREGQLAVKYWVNEPDTLTGVSMYFPSITPTSVGESIDVTVWGDLENDVELRRQSTTIAQSARDQFTFIQFSTPLIVRDTFYIGFTQFTDNYIGVGLDKNNLRGAENIFYNTDRRWVQNTRVEGSLMIRPYFESGSEFILSIDDLESEMVLYPNPATEWIKLEGNFNSFDILGVSGQVLKTFQAGDSKYDISDLKAGLYFLIIRQDQQSISKKLIINK